MRGNAMSGAPIISGTNQLPKPPIIAGMTMKKIMIRPWAVMNTLNVMRLVEDLQARLHAAPAACAIDSAPPMTPRHRCANTRYIVPMSLWLVE